MDPAKFFHHHPILPRTPPPQWTCARAFIPAMSRTSWKWHRWPDAVPPRGDDPAGHFLPFSHESDLGTSFMSELRMRLGQGLRRGLGRGLHGFTWMAKILLPISFLTALLQWSGWLAHLDFLVRPISGLIGLPATAALPMIIGMLTNIYGGIAAMVVLPFTTEQMTLIAIFLLICHNLIQEGVVQAQSGIHPVKATLFRLAAALLTVAVVAPFLRPQAIAIDPGATVSGSRQPFGTMVANWSLLTLKLLAKIFVIIVSILTTLAVFQEFGWIEPVVRAFRPILRMLGLNDKVGLLWMTAAVFGLAYGAAVIVEEAKRGDLTKDELEALHLSIGINHSMVEDPMLFLALGLNAFWLWVPRLIMAMVAVRALTLWTRWRHSRLGIAES